MFEPYLNEISIPNASGANVTLTFATPTQNQEAGEFAPPDDLDPESLEALMNRDPSIRRWAFVANYGKGAV